MPKNSLEQFRQSKSQILISCGWIFWWLRPGKGTQVLKTLKQCCKSKPRFCNKGNRFLHIEKTRGATKQLFNSNNKRPMGSFFNCPSKVAQLLLSIFAIYITRESVPNFCLQFLDLKAQIIKEPRKVLPGSDSYFLWLDFLVAGCGQIRAQVPENSLEQFCQSKPQILISFGWIFWWPAAARKGNTSP